MIPIYNLMSFMMTKENMLVNNKKESAYFIHMLFLQPWCKQKSTKSVTFLFEMRREPIVWFFV